jgi:hypothetical protein
MRALRSQATVTMTAQLGRKMGNEYPALKGVPGNPGNIFSV